MVPYSMAAGRFLLLFATFTLAHVASKPPWAPALLPERRLSQLFRSPSAQLRLRGGSQANVAAETMIDRLVALSADASCGRASLDDGWDILADFPPPRPGPGEQSTSHASPSSLVNAAGAVFLKAAPPAVCSGFYPSSLPARNIPFQRNALWQASSVLLDLVAACAAHGSSANPSGEVSLVVNSSYVAILVV
ncbi:hypothetical protein T484DRAFT_2027206 [Baffinella frigidus]|nr:hypothetical protein T484DRAFT_2027206 [Cryptophyta sp. CCMP2293]